MRPSLSTIRTNIITFKNELRGLNFASFLVTWSGEDTGGVADLVDHIGYVDQPNVPDLGTFPTGHLRRNAFLQYYSMRRALALVPDDFEWIVYLRQDIHIRFKDRDDWFTPGFYNTAHTEPFVCDQLGVAEAPVMRAAWRYDDADLQERILTTERAEDALSWMMSRQNVIPRTCYCDEREIVRT